MKRCKILILALAVFLSASLLIVPNIYASDACTVAGEKDPLVCGTKYGDEELALIATVKNVLSTIYLWIGIISVIFIVVGGLTYMTSQGDPEKIKRGKNTIIYSICGLIVTLAAFAITSFTIGALQGSAEGGTGVSPEDSPFGENRNKVKHLVAPDNVTLIAGQSTTVHVRIVPDYAKDHTVEFSIDNKQVASVDQKGNIRTYRAGTAEITVKSPDGPTKTINLTVKKPIPVTSINVSKHEVTLKKNKTETVKAIPLPSNATDKTLIWESKDPAIATVTQSGLIKAIKSDAETYVTVTARNKQVFAFNKSPNLITLADAEVEEELPKVQVSIKVVVQSEYYACTSTTTNNKKFSGNLEMRDMSLKLVQKASKDFYYYNEGSEISRRGGYTKYVKSLGGIFTMFADKKFKIKSACDYQAAAEYAYGLWTVWGIDYDNGSNYHYWGGRSDTPDAFWKGSGGRYAKGDYAYKDIDTNLSSSDFKNKRRTNCNYAADALNRKTDLPYHNAANEGGGQKITNTRDLRVGDMVHYFRNGPGWRHVAMVGEVYSDYVILYDGGGRFINTKQYKKKVRRGGYGEMMNGTVYDYDWWYAKRYWNIDQSKTLEGLK